MTKDNNTDNELKLSMYGILDDRPISPDNISLLDLRQLSEDFGKFIKGSDDLNLRELSVSVESGCISLSANNYIETTAMQHDCFSIIETNSINQNIDPVRAAVIDNFQAIVRNSPDRKYVISYAGKKITINNTTDYKVAQPVYVDVEDYIYVELYDMGGQTPNVHLLAEDGNRITVPAQKELLMNAGDRLYRKQLVLVSAKEDIKTGERKDYSLLSFENYEPKWDEQKFSALVDWYTPKISAIPGGAEAMINAIRGY